MKRNRRNRKLVEYVLSCMQIFKKFENQGVNKSKFQFSVFSEFVDIQSELVWVKSHLA